MDVLAINTYAGSLLISAKKAGFQIRGSYEDEGYGSSIAKANFPEIKHKERTPWPDEDLSQTIVLGHPPCAAFSQQNNAKSSKGVDAKKFQCTIQAITYALKNRCAALAVESVVPALEGAREVHEKLAAEFSYDIFRILQNSATFQVPQWRPRFWIVFIPRGFCSNFVTVHKPAYRSIGQVMTEADPGPTDPILQKDFEKQIHLLKVNGFTDQNIEQLLNPEETFGGLPSLLKKYADSRLNFKGDVQGLRDFDLGQLAKKYCVGGNFMSHCLRVLDPAGFTTTLLFDSWWCCFGRVLSYDEYYAAMGFPRDYIFPGKTQSKFREFLSRGVCPPVATWILRQIADNLERRTVESSNWVQRIAPGGVIDLNVKRDEVQFE